MLCSVVHFQRRIQMPKETQMNRYQRACQIWAVLAFAASKSQTITYAKLSCVTGLLPPPALGIPLAHIQEFCLIEKLPPLTAIVVQDNGVPGDGFYAVAPEDVYRAQQVVFNHDWDKKPKLTPATFTYEGASKKWAALSAKKQGEYMQACCKKVNKGKR